MSKPRVIFCQPIIAGGGRFRVNISIMKVLNDMGIVPDVLGTRLLISEQEIARKYGLEIKVRFHRVPGPLHLSQDAQVAVFNALLGQRTRGYDLLINSSNSLLFLPRRMVLTYMHFPRKRRIMADEANLHLPELKYGRWSRTGRSKMIWRAIYRLSVPRSHHRIVCNTQFTRDAVLQDYPQLDNVQVIHPPVDTSVFAGDNSEPRERAVVCVGRFAPAKRQLEQIELAAQMPDLPFHIVGFVGSPAYYQACVDRIATLGLNNVHLWPNASFQEMVQRLQSSLIFLHTLINEPYGITAVEAIAAGCIPVVHDSGGQREVVIDSTLRYSQLDKVPAILHRVLDLIPTERMAQRQKLQEHVRCSFDEQVFQEKMHQVLKEC